MPDKGVHLTQGKTYRRGTGLFGKAVLKEAIALAPDLPNTQSLEEIRHYLRCALHFNSEQTRYRYANYILERMFPDSRPDLALPAFAKRFRASAELAEICFYRFLKAEPLEIQVIEDLLLPNLGNGQISREVVTSYLSGRFPMARNINGCAQAVVDALNAGGIASTLSTT